MPRCLLNPVAAVGLLLASCCLTMSGCVIVVDADDELCVSDVHSDDGTPRIGIDVDGVDAALAGQLNIKADGATLVRSVWPGWPAERAGVRQFDVITKVDGSDDASPIALTGAIRAKKPGESVTLTVIRNAQPMDLSVPIVAKPASDNDDE